MGVVGVCQKMYRVLGDCKAFRMCKVNVGPSWMYTASVLRFHASAGCNCFAYGTWQSCADYLQNIAKVKNLPKPSAVYWLFTGFWA